MRRTVRERGLLRGGDHVLHRLRSELGITLCAASIDHGLRPESAVEVRQVGAFAASLGVPFVSVRVEVPAERASIQARARELRYSFSPSGSL